MFKLTPVFHVGFPKTGTTTLQNNVFSRLSYATYLGKYNPDDRIETRDQAVARGVRYLNEDTIRQFYRGFLNVDSLHFDLDAVRRMLGDIAQDIDQTRPFFSHEGALNTRMAYPDVRVKAERIAKVFDTEVRILITVREQKSFLKSSYRYRPYDPVDPRKGRYMTFEAWLDVERQKPWFSLFDHLHFDRVMEMYQSLFGDDRVLVLPMEMMSRAPSDFARRLGSFTGTDAEEIMGFLEDKPANVGVSASWNHYLRLRRNFPVKLRPGSLLPPPLRDGLKAILANGQPRRIQLSTDRAREYDVLYAASNRRLAEKTGIDFAGLGYAV